MSRLVHAAAATVLCASAALAADGSTVPPFAFADGGWQAMGADFLAPASGPGPVKDVPGHEHSGNNVAGVQPTFRMADLSNPILQPWVVAQMKKANDEVIAGKVPFIARERCYPGGVPGMNVYNRGQPLRFIQTPKEVLMINELYASTRHIYMNVPHTKNPKPSWYNNKFNFYTHHSKTIL